MIEKIAFILLILVLLKSIIIGSDFSFLKWIKHGKDYIEKYIDWQKNKP